MSDGGSVLPQAEIDALFKQATGISISPPAIDNPPGDEASVPPANSAPPTDELSQQREAPPPGSPPPKQAEPEATSPATAQSAAPVASSPSTPSTDSLREIGAVLDDLARRLGKVESSINQLNRKEWDAPDVSAPIKKISQKVTALDQNLQKVNGQVNRVMKGLKGTPGYGIRNDFSCTSCGSDGLIAIPMRCTKCGEEGWWGWWPKEK